MYKMEKTIVVTIIENNKKELLLQKKSLDYPVYPGVWCFVGGEAESEDFHKEMLREIKEELGIKMNVKFMFTEKTISKRGKSTFYVFLGKLNDLSKIKIKEGVGIALFGKKELNQLRIDPETKKILIKYFKEF
ncbi:MAG: hypothetical protein BWY36_00396 [Candidatus Diapherotrites archaeon ADurb.Bin253]|mgnify:FL=1|nr:MAG: hypothetical protein BWY36_00396 [Candidatus Diapherotrites archaeon ADurb.Bin253]